MAMLDNIPQFMSANTSFKQHFKDTDLKIAPVRRAAVITCMDARQVCNALSFLLTLRKFNQLTSSLLVSSANLKCVNVAGCQ